MSQEVDAAHAGHAHIEHHAPDAEGSDGLQEGLRRRERLDAKPERHEEIPEGASQGRVVVHDADHPPVAPGHMSLPVLGERHHPHRQTAWWDAAPRKSTTPTDVGLVPYQSRVVADPDQRRVEVTPRRSYRG